MNKRVRKKNNKNNLNWIESQFQLSDMDVRWSGDCNFIYKDEKIIVGVFADHHARISNRGKIVVEFTDLFDKWAEWRNYYVTDIPQNDYEFSLFLYDLNHMKNDYFEYNFGKYLTRKKYFDNDDMSYDEYVKECKNFLIDKNETKVKKNLEIKEVEKLLNDISYIINYEFKNDYNNYEVDVYLKNGISDEELDDLRAKIYDMTKINHVYTNFYE
jgi:hypothetical protein